MSKKGYLQNSICFSSEKEAINDFISNIYSPKDRISFSRVKVKDISARDYFPECTLPSDYFNVFLASLFSLVILCLIIKHIKKAALL